LGAFEPHENEHARNEHHNTNGNKNVDAHHDSLPGDMREQARDISRSMFD
jgi:hypothetical protein